MKKRICCVLLALVLAALAASGLAHSGRTDSSGGHKDNKNASGLGGYHYHCGGNPPHLHANGVCPYASGSGAKTSATQAPKATAAPTQTALPAAAPQSGEPSVPAWAEAYETVQFGMTNIKGVNVRAKASTGAKKLSTLPITGTPLVIVDRVVGDKDEIWYIIWFEDGEGYIKADFIDLVEEAEYWEAVENVLRQ